MGGFVQRVAAAPLGGRDVVLLHVRFVGQTRHLVAAPGLGLGVLSAPARERLRAAMQQAAPRDRAAVRARWEAIVEAAAAAPDDGEDLEAHGDRIVTALVQQQAGGRRDALARSLTKALAKIDRRIEAVRGDLSRAAQSDALASQAQLFVAEAGRAPRGATELVTTDWSSGEPRQVRLPLDPGKPARAQIDALFQRARRLKEGARIGRERLAEAERARSALAQLASELEPPPADLPALEARARAAAPRDFKLLGPPQPRAARDKGVKNQPPLPPYRTFTSSTGTPIRVGRGAEHNDDLTFHVARPHDLWLHAKNRTGAHVIVPLPRASKDASCPADVLVEAAHLAAHFSEARGEDVVEIQYTPRRYLRKPKGSAPGLVVVDREKVLVLRVQGELLRRLLERELAPDPGRP
jgi:predicted ribosome quality control (RQC) complex YloA/Tae2 family protein